MFSENDKTQFVISAESLIIYYSGCCKRSIKKRNITNIQYDKCINNNKMIS